MTFNYLLPLRAVQTFLAIITLGLTAYVADWWGGYWHLWSPSQINFLLFSSIWSLLALIYLIVAPLYAPRAAHKFGILAAEAVTMLFWFAGFIALAVFLTNRVCVGRVCDAAKAAAVFAAFEWLAFAATTVLATMHVVGARSSRTGDKPDMSVLPST